MLISILQFILDSDDPYEIVGQLTGALPPGSYLAISHPTYDFMPPETIAKLDAANARPGVVFRPRSREEFARFFERLEQVPRASSRWPSGAPRTRFCPVPLRPRQLCTGQSPGSVSRRGRYHAST